MQAGSFQPGSHVHLGRSMLHCSIICSALQCVLLPHWSLIYTRRQHITVVMCSVTTTITPQGLLCILCACQVVLAGGKLYMAKSTMVTSSTTGGGSSGRLPAVAWAELSLAAEAIGSESCPQSQAGRTSANSWNWARDYSVNWGAEVRFHTDLARSG